MSDYILDARHLTKTYEGDVQILRDVSLVARKGQSIAIMGKSGEGKTTLLHILGTLETPSAGEVYICGKQVTPSSLSLLRNRFIGFVFQAYYLLEDYTTIENILLPLKIAREPTGTKSAAYERALTLLEELGLSEKAHLHTKWLSGGEKQRVTIARALICDAPLILADEPTGNLDHLHAASVQNLLLNSVKKYGKTLILVTHDADFAHHCDQVLLLKEGLLYTVQSN